MQPIEVALLKKPFWEVIHLRMQAVIAQNHLGALCLKFPAEIVYLLRNQCSCFRACWSDSTLFPTTPHIPLFTCLRISQWLPSRSQALGWRSAVNQGEPLFPLSLLPSLLCFPPCYLSNNYRP